MRFVGEQAAAHFDAGIAQHFQAASRHLRVRVFHGRHHAFHLRLDQRVGARRRAAEVAAWLERHVGGGAAQVMAA